MSREESRRFRAELAVSEAERLKAVQRTRELDTMNRLLRVQLSDTTHSFRQALDTAARFLAGGEHAA